MMYGSAHSSIIGFISTEWINLSKDNSIFDGAPSPITGKGRSGQKNADLLLCERNRPLIVVEVESGVSKYTKKIESILDYFKKTEDTEDFDGLQWGLMVMSNVYYGGPKKDKKDENYVQCKHNWEKIKEKVKEEGKDSAIALVSIEKSKAQLDKSTPWGRLRKRNNYYPWDIVNIDYWIHSGNHDKDVEGNLFKI